MEALATKQGLLGVVLDGIQQLPEGQRPPKVQMLQWIGQVVQGYEQRYVEYRKAIDSLATFYTAHGFRMMLLKGYACGRDWPRPEHRPYGDIDIWLFGKQKEADVILAKETGIVIDSSHHHHTVFNWMGFTVENHYDFVNVHALRASAGNQGDRNFYTQYIPSYFLKRQAFLQGGAAEPAVCTGTRPLRVV